MHVKIITTMPEAFPGPLGLCLLGKALEAKVWSCEVIDLKEFGIGKHRKVDDRPFGGGAGMVICPEVVARALDYALDGIGENYSLVYTSARGAKFTQAIARDVAQTVNNLVVLCGRFEGIDQRVIDVYQAQELCIGDFVLSGGETAALVIVDACVRLLPGVLGNEESIVHESFSIYEGDRCLIEYPQYTRPRVWRGVEVPGVLLSGDHASVERWRRSEAVRTTRAIRRDLWGDV
jgi:tRNA (guanine37-N1)-methyltransferase